MYQGLGFTRWRTDAMYRQRESPAWLRPA
jgi:hypothetical protein